MHTAYHVMHSQAAADGRARGKGVGRPPRSRVAEAVEHLNELADRPASSQPGIRIVSLVITVVYLHSMVQFLCHSSHTCDNHSNPAQALRSKACSDPNQLIRHPLRSPCRHRHSCSGRAPRWSPVLACVCTHICWLAHAMHHITCRICWCRMLYYMHRPRWYRMRRIRCSSRHRMHHRPLETARLTYGRCASRAVHSTASRRGAECSRPSHSAKWLCSRSASHSCDDQHHACRVSRD